MVRVERISPWPSHFWSLCDGMEKAVCYDVGSLWKLSPILPICLEAGGQGWGLMASMTPTTSSKDLIQ